jgi:hypothetical protein
MKQETFLKSFALQQEQIDYLESLSKLGFNLSAVVRQALDLHRNGFKQQVEIINAERKEVKDV